MNKMTEKLINDASETKKAKMNMISTAIGGVLLLMGMVFLLIKSASVEYIDEAGILHENFFLLPIRYLFMLAGIIVLAVSGISYLKRSKKN